MADALIETITSNPYESILSDTSWQIWNVQEDINKVTSAISTLEKQSPTSPTLPKLRERLAQLQDKMSSLNKTYDSAKTLLSSYNDSLANANTMEWIYKIKQTELDRAQKEADQSYRKMYEDVKRWWENYINALWNATSSENAIINANAWIQWASAQSTAEARARNYLANAQAQAEASNNMIANLNAINEWRLNSNAWYVQLSQSNADNTLRQQVMNNFDAQQSSLNRQAQYWWWSRSSNLSNIKLPDTTKNPKPWTNTSTWLDVDIVDPYTITNTDATNYFTEQSAAWAYWSRNSDVAHYQNDRRSRWTLTNWPFDKNVANLDKTKVRQEVEKINKQYWEDFNLDAADWWITDKNQLVLVNTRNENWKEMMRQRVIPLEKVSDRDYYKDENWKKIYFR